MSGAVRRIAAIVVRMSVLLDVAPVALNARNAKDFLSWQMNA
jgi:hypothetical protein